MGHSRWLGAGQAAACRKESRRTPSPDEPGQFAFADPDRIHRILTESSWTGIDIRPIDMACALPERELDRYFTLLGPVGPILRDTDDRTRTQVTETARAAFDAYWHGTNVRFTAACWTAGARASSAPTDSTGTAHA
ncbi:hypothetical protein [Streptomyces sp. NPDC000878]